MSETLFIRLLHHDDKGAALAERITALRDGGAVDDVHAVDPASFRQVPNTPFCYWVSERIRQLFKELPPFESEGRTVKVGMQTGDDFRFVRAWWEVPAGRILDSGQWAVGSGRKGQEEKWTEERIREFQTWCLKRTYEGKRWVPFAKGGEYSPYYADIHLFVNWENEGAEMKAFSGSVIRNPDYYFRPGLTWPLRAHRFAPQVMPIGSVFSVRGYSAFPEPGNETSTLAVFNSDAFDFIFKTALGRFGFPEFIVGVLQVLPWRSFYPERAERIGRLAEEIIFTKRLFEADIENSHAFTLPALLQVDEETLAERAMLWAAKANDLRSRNTRIQDDIHQAAFDLYGFTEEDRKAVRGRQCAVSGEEDADVVGKEEGDEEEATDADSIQVEPVMAAAYCQQHTAHLLSWCVGVALGRWDVRFALPTAHCPLPAAPPDPFDPLPVCPPGMLVGPDGLPAQANRIVSEEWLRKRQCVSGLWTVDRKEGDGWPLTTDHYPLRISWDGVLVDDPGGFSGQWAVGSGQPPKDDIVRRVREVLEVLFPDKPADSTAHCPLSTAHSIEQEACDILGVSDLRDYFRRPAGFFQDHLKRYSKSRRKAPIYWPLSTASGSYTVWLYYHRLTDQTLYMVVNKYVEPKISEVQNAVDSMQYAVEARERGITGNLPSAYGLLPTSQLRKQWEDARTFLGELRDLREELLRIAALPYKPDLNDGVIINAAPLHKLFRLRSWAKDTEDCWKKLQKGDYDWAHLAYTIWPDRVREVCKRDRSIAVAHGLEDLCEVPVASVGPPKRRRKRGGK